MDFRSLAIRMILLSQTTAGILGNFSLIFYYPVLCSRGCVLKPTDLIVLNLMAANALIILSAGVPHTIAAFGVKPFLNNVGCRLLICMQAFGRSVSIGTICLLSVFRAMSIRFRESCWKDHKVRPVNYTACTLSLLWVFYMLINFIFFLYPLTKLNSKNTTRKRDFGYCSIVGRNEISDSLYAALVVCPEVLFSVLIALSSGSMIVTLYRHKQSVQHIRSKHASSRTSPESRATQNILVLVSNFLAFYTLSSILQGCIALLDNHDWWLTNITRLTSLCFPSFGPFVLMNHYTVVSRLSLIWIRNKK
ncbi:vomeronasal type-1 receptor 4-like isoform X1 [Cricetulus griseus]|uniref:vomeronasal type-1 receptor 4-like isoform X1 n=1 Tax=Cricetulus griseus TaxID=10029 RepID=UPI0004545BA6|nr:vomeronasal type-1 receptor 4-like isoform X1 [Cricetulus griseus]